MIFEKNLFDVKTTLRKSETISIFLSVTILVSRTIVQMKFNFYTPILLLSALANLIYLSFHTNIFLDKYKTKISICLVIFSFMCHILAVIDDQKNSSIFKGIEISFVIILLFKWLRKNNEIKFIILSMTLIFLLIFCKNEFEDIITFSYHIILATLIISYSILCGTKISLNKLHLKSLFFKKRSSSFKSSDKQTFFETSKKFTSTQNNLSKITIEEKSKNLDFYSPINPFLEKQQLAFELMNYLNEGIILLDRNNEILYANNCVFDVFETFDIGDLKTKLLNLVEIPVKNKFQSEYNKIPERALENIFHSVMNSNISKIFNNMTYPSSLEFNEEEKNATFNKNTYTYLTLKSKKLNNSSFFIDETNENDAFTEKEKWAQHNLNDNGEFLTQNNTSKNFETSFHNKSPNNVQKFLAKLFNYCKSKISFHTKTWKPNNRSSLDIEKYIMYTTFKSTSFNSGVKTTNKSILALNFIPLMEIKNQNRIFSKDFDSMKRKKEKNNSKIFVEDPKINNLAQDVKGNIIIMIRKIDELPDEQAKNSNSKLLGSFCHEFRTPLNSIINMLDLTKAQLEDKSCGIGKENISNALISSNLLLSTIDDFIDYFSLFNELLKLDLCVFEPEQFLKEIASTFSFITGKKSLEFSLIIEDNIPRLIKSDQKKIRQILYNLLSIIKICFIYKFDF